MTNTVICAEHLSKSYRLGQIGSGTLSQDINAWWAKVRGKPNPLLEVGVEDHGNREGEIIWALKDVNFFVEQGEALGIIGRNGAGKSTLLKILSRVTAPTVGKIKVKGRISSLLEVGTGFHPDLTGRENIYLNGAILGMNRKEISRKFDEIVDFAEIEQFIDTPVKRYSSGMYVRLAFAVAAHLESEIMIVDEVLAVGDTEFQRKCLGKMGDVAQGGRTVLFVSHNLKAIEGLCKSSYWFNNGELMDKGNSTDIIRKYLNTNSSGYHIRVQTSDLSFNGILNKDELSHLRPSDNLSISLGFTSGSIYLESVGIDLALLNSKGEWVLHLRSNFVSSGFDIFPEQDLVVNYHVESPSLSPGAYKLILYVFSIKKGKPILWIEEIDACNVSPVASGYFPNINYIDQVRSAVIPKYTLEVNQNVNDG